MGFTKERIYDEYISKGKMYFEHEHNEMNQIIVKIERI